MFKKLLLFLVLALAVGASIPKTRAMMADELRPTVDKVKAKLVPGRLEAMTDQMMATLRTGMPLPTAAGAWEAWLRLDYSGKPNDPWGHRYYIQAHRDGFTVGSMGPDGKKNTADDITLRHRNANR